MSGDAEALAEILQTYFAAERNRAEKIGGAKALEDAADAIQPGDHNCFKPWCPYCATRKSDESRQRWLRDRAAALRAALPTVDPEARGKDRT